MGLRDEGESRAKLSGTIWAATKSVLVAALSCVQSKHVQRIYCRMNPRIILPRNAVEAERYLIDQYMILR